MSDYQTNLKVIENSFFSGIQFKIINSVFLAILITGLVGNVLNMIVFKRMTKNLTFKILLFTAIIDFVVILLCLTEVCLNFKRVMNVRDLHALICKFDTFFFFYLTQCHNFLIMTLTIVRAKVVCTIYTHQNNFNKPIAAKNEAILKDTFELNTLNESILSNEKQDNDENNKAREDQNIFNSKQPHATNWTSNHSTRMFILFFFAL